MTGSRIRSEGKLLEVMPIIYTADGSMMTLPPVVWTVPNWLLGMSEEYISGNPNPLWFNQRLELTGSNTAWNHQLSFFVRVMEYSPDSTPVPTAITMEQAEMLASVLRGL